MSSSCLRFSSYSPRRPPISSRQCFHASFAATASPIGAFRYTLRVIVSPWKLFAVDVLSGRTRLLRNACATNIHVGPLRTTMWERATMICGLCAEASLFALRCPAYSCGVGSNEVSVSCTPASQTTSSFAASVVSLVALTFGRNTLAHPLSPCPLRSMFAHTRSHASILSHRSGRVPNIPGPLFLHDPPSTSLHRLLPRARLHRAHCDHRRARRLRRRDLLGAARQCDREHAARRGRHDHRAIGECLLALLRPGSVRAPARESASASDI